MVQKVKLLHMNASGWPAHSPASMETGMWLYSLQLVLDWLYLPTLEPEKAPNTVQSCTAVSHPRKCLLSILHRWATSAVAFWYMVRLNGNFFCCLVSSQFACCQRTSWTNGSMVFADLACSGMLERTCSPRMMEYQSDAALAYEAIVWAEAGFHMPSCFTFRFSVWSSM